MRPNPVRPRHIALFALLPLLAACTGTEENPPTLRLALLTGGGSALQTVSANEAQGGVPPATPLTIHATPTVTGRLSLNTAPNGRRILLTRQAQIESRDADLADVQAFTAPPQPPLCLTQSVSSVARDRLLALSECPGDAQRLVLYRENGTLVWTATLPTFVTPIPHPDNPPIRLGVLGDVGIVTRPTSDTTSEVIRVAQASTGATTAEASLPLPTPAIRDLTPYNAELLAATDTGIKKLTATGEPETGSLSAFGGGRVDRLWSGTASTRNLLAAWHDPARTSAASAPLRLWDGVKTSAATVVDLTDLRDVTLAPDGFLYALSTTTLLRYDAVIGLQNSNWAGRTLTSTLNEARALTWVVPPETP